MKQVYIESILWTHLKLRQTNFWFTYSFKFRIRLNLYCRSKEQYFPKENNKSLKVFKNPNRLPKIYKQNLRILLFLVSMTVLRNIKCAVVAPRLSSLKFLNCTWELKSTSQNKIIYVITFVEIVAFIFFTDFLAF